MRHRTAPLPLQRRMPPPSILCAPAPTASQSPPTAPKCGMLQWRAPARGRVQCAALGRVQCAALGR
eukprot:scaffold24658_cov113-Isochrysis_galbana.AAC.1